MSKYLTGGGLPPSSLLIRPRGKTLTSPTFYELQPLCLILGSHIPTLTSEGWEGAMGPDKGVKHVTLQEIISLEK